MHDAAAQQGDKGNERYGREPSLLRTWRIADLWRKRHDNPLHGATLHVFGPKQQNEVLGEASDLMLSAIEKQAASGVQNTSAFSKLHADAA